jgi:hypothetical protein
VFLLRIAGCAVAVQQQVAEFVGCGEAVSVDVVARSGVSTTSGRGRCEVEKASTRMDAIDTMMPRVSIVLTKWGICSRPMPQRARSPLAAAACRQVTRRRRCKWC